jgi:hypothetical protein
MTSTFVGRDNAGLIPVDNPEAVGEIEGVVRFQAGS